MKAVFLNKQGEMAIRIASMLSELEVGERIPNISDLSVQLSAGAGTVQTALKMLETEGAIKLQTRGHQGTTLESIDRILLYRLTDQSWIAGSMPLPYTTRLEGLATALYKQFESVKIPFNIQYMRGGKARLDRLASGTLNFAICSKMTAMLAQQDYPNLEILIEFDAHSYMDKPAMVFAREEETEIQDGMKIGIDEYSYDHIYLNERVCQGKDVTFVPLKYSELFEKLNKGEIDASLWNHDELKERFILKNVHELDDTIVKEMEDACTAVLVIRNDDIKLQLLMTDILDIDEIHHIQSDVLDKNILPAY